MTAAMSEFQLPRYREIPSIGLYLEQTAKYINECLAPLRCIEVTTSMISNYVKKGYVSRPEKKQYSAEQIAYLLYIAVAKQVLSMENIDTLLQMQRAAYSTQEAYDYFCSELEHALHTTFETGDTIAALPADKSQERKMLRSVVIAVAHVIYLSYCFDTLKAPAPLPAETL